jgi:hypothetical protein
LKYSEIYYVLFCKGIYLTYVDTKVKKPKIPKHLIRTSKARRLNELIV